MCLENAVLYKGGFKINNYTSSMYIVNSMCGVNVFRRFIKCSVDPITTSQYNICTHVCTTYVRDDHHDDIVPRKLLLRENILAWFTDEKTQEDVVTDEFLRSARPVRRLIEEGKLSGCNANQIRGRCTRVINRRLLRGD